jgi:hypothetical protein
VPPSPADALHPAPRPDTACPAAGSAAIDALVARFVGFGLTPSAALAVLGRAARRHDTTVEALAVRIVTGSRS